MTPATLNIGGLVAVAFDPPGRYLLTVSHSGRGVFDTHTWQRVARDGTRAYPRGSVVEGIGPLAGQHLNAIEINYENGILIADSPSGEWTLTYESGIATITPTPK